MAEIRVAIVDAHVMMREGLAAQLDLVEGIRVVWQGSEGDDLLSHYAVNPPDRPQVVVMAVWIQGKVGVSTTKRLKQLNQSVRVIGLTFMQDMEVIRRMMEAGAYGCVHKSEQLSALVEMIRAAWHGTDPVDPGTSAALDAHLTRRRNWPTDSGFPAADGADQIVLTPREYEVLHYICHACDNRTIARHMGISARTVQTHLTHIYEKLQVRG